MKISSFSKFSKFKFILEESYDTTSIPLKENQLVINDVLECTVEKNSRDNELDLQEIVPENILVNLANDKTSIG